jgi:hypothetical protein
MGTEKWLWDKKRELAEQDAELKRQRDEAWGILRGTGITNRTLYYSDLPEALQGDEPSKKYWEKVFKDAIKIGEYDEVKIAEVVYPDGGEETRGWLVSTGYYGTQGFDGQQEALQYAVTEYVDDAIQEAKEKIAEALTS